ncbi:hypothetical protein LUZ60_010595 [Juncus effusus]|nr:hypothetical protein LUZ60_010595 [Juncus effusus]
MAKKKNKNKGATPMDFSSPGFVTSPDAPQPMDTSEGKSTNLGLSSINRKITKGVQVRRAKNVRKMKAVAHAISRSEKTEEKITKNKSKQIRVQSAKTLYD